MHWYTGVQAASGLGVSVAETVVGQHQRSEATHRVNVFVWCGFRYAIVGHCVIHDVVVVSVR